MVVASTPGLSETLAGDRRKAARFYARFGVTEAQFRHGELAADDAGATQELTNLLTGGIAQTGVTLVLPETT